MGDTGSLDTILKLSVGINDLAVVEEILKLMARLNDKYSYDTMDKRVEKYNNAMNGITNNSPKYSELRKEIMNILWGQGWYPDSNCFRREPEREDLVRALSITVNKYLY